MFAVTRNNPTANDEGKDEQNQGSVRQNVDHHFHAKSFSGNETILREEPYHIVYFG